MKTARRFGELDGVRGVAAIGVAFYHIHPQGTFWLWSFVDLFFVLSGFLITGILLNLEEWTWPNIRNFWMRRVLRIWPVYYLVLCGVLLLWFGWCVKHGKAISPFSGFWESTLFLHYLVGDYAALPPGVNYLWWFGHSWSLAVEEQFYLLWPPILYVLRRNTLACCVALLSLVCIVCAIRSFGGLSSYMLATRGDGLVLGSVLAVLYYSENYRQFWARGRPFVKYLAPFVGVVVGSLLAPYFMSGYAESGPNHQVLTDDVQLPAKFALAYTFFVWVLVSDAYPFVNRILSAPLLVYLGSLSYAIYMIHLPVQKFLDQLYNSGVISSRSIVEVVFWVVVLAMAEISRRFYESRFERLKVLYPLPA